MADLTTEQKTVLVTALAHFNTPAEVSVMMLEEYGIEITIQHVCSYDPTRPAFRAGDKWVEIFTAARKHYLEDVQSVPIANQGFRLRALNKTYEKAIKAKNNVLANATLEQAAKEVGGVLTNERNLKVEKTGGGMADLTAEERRMAVAEMLREALSKDKAQTAPTSGATQ